MEKKHLTRRDVIANSQKSLSRRDFMKLTGITAAATLMAASGPQAVMAEPFPVNAPETTELDIWYNSDIPDLFDLWDPNDPTNKPFQNEWYYGGQARTAFIPWLNNNPGVTLKITTHGWDAELRQNQLNAIASGSIPDTTYGEAYVTEFTRMGVYRPVSSTKAALFPDSTTAGAHWNGNYWPAFM